MLLSELKRECWFMKDVSKQVCSGCAVNLTALRLVTRRSIPEYQNTATDALSRLTFGALTGNVLIGAYVVLIYVYVSVCMYVCM